MTVCEQNKLGDVQLCWLAGLSKSLD